jgi:hypothetical protein
MSQGGLWQSRSFGVRRLSGHEPKAMGSMAGFRVPDLDPAWSGSAPSAEAIGQPAVGGGGLRTEAAVLNNPAAGRMPAVGKAPSSGILSTGQERHAIPGVTLPFAVILTAHRLRSPLPSARQTASGLGGKSNEQKQVGRNSKAHCAMTMTERSNAICLCNSALLFHRSRLTVNTGSPRLPDLSIIHGLLWWVIGLSIVHNPAQYAALLSPTVLFSR